MTKWRDDPALFDKEWAPAPFLPVANNSAFVGTNGQRLTDLDFAVSTALTFEAHFWGPAVTKFCRTWWFASYVATILYIILWQMGQKYMQSRPAFDLKGPLNAWNLFLAVFSFIGSVRTLPHLLLNFSTFGFQYTLCRSAAVSYGSGACGF